VKWRWSMFRRILASLLLAGWSAWALAESISVIAGSELPPEARQTLALIKQGGPYPFHKDGVIFGNYQHSLPEHARGYYREFTVPTPGIHSRGGRRIVVGGALPGVEYFFTGDHYRTFKRIQD